MKVYISGPISGTTDYIERFWEAEIKLREKKLETVNPVTISIAAEKTHGRKLSWAEYMEIDMREIKDCDAIYMLKGWEKSKGACVEYAYALTHNLEIYFEVLEPDVDAAMREAQESISENVRRILSEQRAAEKA